MTPRPSRFTSLIPPNLKGHTTMLTLLHEQRETTLPNVDASGDALWLDRHDIEATTGWAWKPEGLCRDEVCVPLPRDAAHPVVDHDKLDLAAMWRYMGQPVVRDASATTWVFGTGPAQRASALASLEAPDFELPDLDGKLHRLSDYRGKKVFLATWASW